MLRELRQGGEVIMVPDGPKGPNRKFQARSYKTGPGDPEPVSCLSLFPARGKNLHQVGIDSYGSLPSAKWWRSMENPSIVPSDLSDEQFEDTRKHLEQVLIALDDTADALF